jgi:putative NADH-flavin reductase
MKLTVFGASGRIGGLAIKQALDSGHKVAAVVRQSSGFDLEHPGLEVVRVPELTDPAVLAPALDGADAVLSGVGPRSRKDTSVASSTTRVILAGLAAADVRRFVAVSAAPVIPAAADDSWLNRRLLYPFIRSLLREIYDDARAMEDDIRHSDTQWTVVRPPRLTDKPLTGRYRTAIEANPPHGYTIGRADVAHALLAVLEDPSTIGKTIGVAS